MAAASSGLTVTRTHRLMSLRTNQCQAWRKRRALRTCLAALLLVGRFALRFRLIQYGVLNVAGALFRLQHWIKDGLFGWRIGRGATKDEQNR
jgi:hypothetical protein